MIQLPDELKVIKEDNKNLSFELVPLYPGYGVTVGNTLRRVLLSSIEGSAITTVKIKDVSHEFTNIPGVLEDVIEIVMNIKRIRLRSFSHDPVTITLSTSGAKEIKAKDIKTPTDVEIINTDLHIATITEKKASLEIEMIVERGIGYVPVEQRQKEKISVGTIAVDAVFSPIQNVNFKVENVRVGQRTDYNKLVMEIESDGTISPREALRNSLDIILNHFTALQGSLGGDGTSSSDKSEDTTELEAELNGGEDIETPELSEETEEKAVKAKKRSKK